MEEKKFLALIEDSIRNNWDLPALTDYNNDPFLYKDFARKIAKLHLLFEAMNLQKGEKVAICGRNSANWVVAFFATISYGAVIATVLHDFNEESIQNIVNHSEARVLFAGDHVWAKLDPVQMPGVDTIFLIDDFSIQKANSPELIAARFAWAKAFSEKYPNGFTKDDIKFYDEKPEELAVLNYTSGTTSTPKGVMLPFRSLWSNTKYAMDMIPFVKAGDGVVSMLPMAHMFGLAFEILLSISKGCHIHFLTRVPSPKIILEAFSRVNPPLVITVPLIIEKIIQNNVFAELNKQPVKTLIKLPFFRKKIYAKVAAKIRPLFGNKMVEVAVGGAALNKEVGNFLDAIKFPYTVGYGMTECGPLIAYEYWDTFKSESCGRPMARMQIKVNSPQPETVIGELIVKGDNVMLGYYKNPEATAAVLSEDGWLNTGDLVTMDKDNFIFIKGRSKTMVLGPSGQNIYPEEIEDLLNNSPYIAEVLVIEEKGKLIALIYPDKEYLEKHHVKEKNTADVFAVEVKAVNKRLPSFSQITNFRIQENEFEKTPKRSIKRFLYQR